MSPRRRSRAWIMASLVAAAMAVGVAPASASIHAGFMDMITDSSLLVAIPKVVRPAPGQTFLDPVFGTRMTRIAGETGTAIGNGVSGTWGSDVRHHYSKDQPWNSDGTLMALQNSGSGIILLDGETYQPRYGKCSGYSLSEDRWHPSRAYPHVRINIKGGEAMWYDVVKCVKLRTWTLPLVAKGFGPGEGNPSNDGRFAALTDGTKMFVLDMDPQAPLAPYPNVRMGPSVNIDECGLSGGCLVDWVSISPSGKYVVVSYEGDFPRVFDVDPTTLALTPRVMPSTAPRCHGTAALGYIYDLGHADMALNPFDNNEDVILGQEHCGNRGRTVGGVVMSGVVMVRLRDGAITPLTSHVGEGYPHHISTRNLDRPGWAYVGYHTDGTKKYTDEMLAVKLDGSKSVQRFAHKHSAYSGCYRCESHSVPSPDGRRILFASNWAQDCIACGSSSDIKPYVVDARPSGADVIAPAAITDLGVLTGF